MTYAQIITAICTGLLQNFEQVYHSAETVEIENFKHPAINIGEEWISLAPDDRKEILYIRRNGPDEALDDFRVGSCITSYKMRTPLRIVYFKDRASCHPDILAKLMQSALIKHTKLVRILQDKWRLQKEESSGDYHFGPTTAYFALDIYAIWQLLPDSCDQDLCVEMQNPLT